MRNGYPNIKVLKRKDEGLAALRAPLPSLLAGGALQSGRI